MLTKLSLMIQKIVSKQLSGIFITDKECVVVDGHRLTRVKHLSVQDKMDRHVILKAADAVSLSKMAGKEPIEVVESTESKISFRVGTNKTTFRPLEGEFIEYLRIVPSNTDGYICIVFDPKLMKDLMEIHSAAGDCVQMYIHLQDPNSNAIIPIILESTQKGGQNMQSLLLPMRKGEGYQARRYSV